MISLLASAELKKKTKKKRITKAFLSNWCTIQQYNAYLEALLGHFGHHLLHHLSLNLLTHLLKVLLLLLTCGLTRHDYKINSMSKDFEKFPTAILCSK